MKRSRWLTFSINRKEQEVSGILAKYFGEPEGLAAERLKLLGNATFLQALFADDKLGERDIIWIGNISVIFKDESWTRAKLEYRINGKAYVLPLEKIAKGVWKPGPRWTYNDYYKEQIREGYFHKKEGEEEVRGLPKDPFGD